MVLGIDDGIKRRYKDAATTTLYCIRLERLLST